jgi:guanylate kinase
VGHVHNHRYGTSKKAIEERMAQGADVILEIDFQGALQIKNIFANAISIFILPPSWEELRSRLERRGEDARSHRCAHENAAMRWPRWRNSTSL